MVFWPPPHDISTPIPMVFWPPYPWYIYPPIHGILTPLPRIFWTPIHSISTALPMVYRTPYPCYFHLLAYLLIRNEGGQITMGFNLPLMGGSVFNKRGQHTMDENWSRGQFTMGSIFIWSFFRHCILNPLMVYWPSSFLPKERDS